MHLHGYLEPFDGLGPRQAERHVCTLPPEEGHTRIGERVGRRSLILQIENPARRERQKTSLAPPYQASSFLKVKQIVGKVEHVLELIIRSRSGIAILAGKEVLQ